MMIKLDIKKAYDNVNQEFLMMVLHKFGFDKHWCNWVLNCFSNPRISVLVNGSP